MVATLLALVKMHTLLGVPTPLIFDQIITFQDRFDNEVVLIIATLEEITLHYRQLSLVYPYQTRFRLSYSHLLPYL